MNNTTSRQVLLRTVATSLAFSAAALALSAGTARADQAATEQHAHSRSNVVYVDANDPRPGQNAVLGFRRGDDGQLVPLPGSPFLTGGTGIGDDQSGLGVEDSSQDILVNEEHTLLFAVNPGSDSIAVFRIDDDGGLTPAPGSPFPSGGVEPVSVGLSGNRLYVVHKDLVPGRPPGASPGYTGFHVAKNGVLTPIPDSTVLAPAGSSPSQALISPDRRFVFDAVSLTGSLEVLRIGANGRLFQVPGAPIVVPGGVLPLGLAAHPTERLVYAGFATATQVGVFEYDAMTGTPSFVGAAGTSGVAPCWLAVEPSGETLYSVNPGDRSVSRLDLANPREPVEVQHVALHAAGAGGLPFQIALDQQARYVYVVSQQAFAFDEADAAANALHVLRVDDGGALVEVPSSPVPLPIPYFARAQGVVAL
jgi:6-phosphogluconolactonase (cycloisomerase 2 family)